MGCLNVKLNNQLFKSCAVAVNQLSVAGDFQINLKLS